MGKIGAGTANLAGSGGGGPAGGGAFELVALSLSGLPPTVSVR